MKKIALLALCTSLCTGAAFIEACSGDNNQNDGGTDGSIPDQNSPDVNKNDGGSDSGIPAPPTLKTQVDRMGRPAINTALNHVFDTDAGSQGVAKDAYNADKNQATWGTSYGPEFAKNLAIFDALDTVCGNAAGYSISNSYSALAGLTADDRLYLKTDSSTSAAGYLAVELNKTGIKANTDMGGRMLTYDVIDVTYGAVSGVLTGVPDGITADSTKTSGTTFPYLAPAP